MIELSRSDEVQLGTDHGIFERFSAAIIILSGPGTRSARVGRASNRLPELLETDFPVPCREAFRKLLAVRYFIDHHSPDLSTYDRIHWRLARQWIATFVSLHETVLIARGRFIEVRDAELTGRASHP